MASSNLTAERLREVLQYSPDSGEFIWRHGNRFAGKAAGSVRKDGYRSIKIDQTPWLAHRLVWLYIHSRWPIRLIDHINGRRDDNRLCNLRDVDDAGNAHNINKTRAASGSSVMGVRWHKRGKKWNARICVNYKELSLGLFDRLEDAEAAYLAAKAVHHKIPDAHGFRRPKT